MSAAPFWKPSELARALGISYDTVNRWRKAGLIRAENFGPRSWRIPRDEVRFIVTNGYRGLLARRMRDA